MQTALLPVNLPPQRDETLTSWILRLAAAHGLTGRAFLRIILGRKTEANRDWEGVAAKAIVGGLAAKTGRSPDALLRDHTLFGYAGVCFERVTSGVNRWVLARQIVGVHCHRPWIGYCPACLAQAAYFRRSWRLSALTACADHGLRLLMSCPRCRASVNYHRYEIGRHPSEPAQLLCACHACRFDLREAEPEHVSEDERAQARKMASVLTGQPSFVGGRELASPEMLNALWTLLACLTSRKPRLRAWQDELRRELGLSFSGEGLSDQIASSAQRAELLQAAWGVFDRWPDAFILTARRAKAYASDFATVRPLVRWIPAAIARKIDRAARLKKTKRLDELREFVRTRRRDWYRLPQLARAAVRAGFYHSHWSQALPTLGRLIGELRIAARGSRIRQTHCVERGSAQWSQLLRMAAAFRKHRCRSKERLREGIVRLCKGRYLSTRDLAELLRRSPAVLKSRHLSELVRLGRLRTRMKSEHAGIKNHPHQAYCAA